MTRKDFELIARVIANKGNGTRWDYAEHMARELEKVYGLSNTHFDRMRFLKACGFSKEWVDSH